MVLQHNMTGVPKRMPGPYGLQRAYDLPAHFGWSKPRGAVIARQSEEYDLSGGEIATIARHVASVRY